MQALDTMGRPLRSLRISVTDRCNLRCRYCMPEDEYAWIPREQVLTFEEIRTLVEVFVELGVEKIRITGGEPLLQRDLHVLIKMLSAQAGAGDLAMTTNGILLAKYARALADAGLARVTVSLDTLHCDRFKSLTRHDALDLVIQGIEAARLAGMAGLKINTVIMRGFNDDELINMLEFSKRIGAEVRFIEYMDVGGATQWSMPQVVSRTEILDRLTKHYGSIEPLPRNDRAPAERFMLPDSTRFGIISSTTAPFCGSCDRSRLTADGIWYMCLYAKEGLDLKSALRSGAPKDTIASLIASSWQRRADRGAEERLAVQNRAAFVPLADLRRDYHLEMHTRGG